MADNRDNVVVVHDAAAGRWLRFAKPLQVFAAHSPTQAWTAVQALEKNLACGKLWAAGFLSYECAPAFDRAFEVHGDDGAFPCLWFGVFRAPREVSGPPPHTTDAASLAWQPTVSRREYGAALRRIRRYIAAGDTYQVNYSFRLRSPFDADPEALFARMVAAQGPGFSAYVSAGRWAICSATPELFFRRNGTSLISRPMKGTAARGLGADDDRRQAAWLRHSEKNRAENVMIVDMVRNDSGRIADAGTVTVPRLYDVEQYPTVWQMTSTVECRTAAGLSEALRALFPPASITGAPKVRTMQIISELETTPRRIYTGSIGFIAPNGDSQFNVAIRTVLIDRERGQAEYGIGGGLVWDSEEGSEYEECLTKAKVLTHRRPEFRLLETMLWRPGRGFFLLDLHLRRLCRSAAYFGIDLDGQAIRRHLDGQAKAFSPQPCRVRLLVADNRQLTVEHAPLPPPVKAPRVCLSPHSVDSSNPFLYHKTTHRTVYEEALAACPGVDDVILWNERGEITESCIANVAVELKEKLYTPPVACGLLPGTYRQHLLRQGKMQERVIRRKELSDCSALYLLNSVRKMVRVDAGNLREP